MAGRTPAPAATASGRRNAVRVGRRGSALHLVLDDERNRNRLSMPVLRALRSAVDTAGHLQEDGVRVVVLESSSRRIFSAGADLAEMDGLGSPDDASDLASALPALIKAMRQCPVPVLARVDGLCLAGGVGVVLGADVVVCADTAQFGLTEVDVGLWPFVVSAVLMPHCSPKKALDLMLTAEWIDARTACELGLVSRVAAADELDLEMDRVISTMAGKPASALRLGKSAFYDTAALPPDEGLEYARQRLASSLGDPAVRGRIAAFQAVASRRPVHTPRNGGR